jgi:hypothetical protein
MSGFGGAGAFSDGKYNITNDFGGTLYEYIGKQKAMDLLYYVDEINMEYGGEGTKLYTTAGSKFKKECIQHDLHLLDASVRHLGTDINYVVLSNLYDELHTKIDFFFNNLSSFLLLSSENNDGCNGCKSSCSSSDNQCLFHLGIPPYKIWLSKFLFHLISIDAFLNTKNFILLLYTKFKIMSILSLKSYKLAYIFL